MIIDMSNTEVKSAGPVDGVYEALADGKYQAEVSKVEEKTSKNGNQYFKVQFTLTENNAEGQGKGRKVWENYMIIESMLWKLGRLLECAGISLSAQTNVTPASLMGTAVTLTLEQDEFEGKTQNRVKYVDPPKGGIKKAVTSASDRFNV